MSKDEKKEQQDDDLELDDYKEDEENLQVLRTHDMVNNDLCGDIKKIEAGYVEVSLATSSSMVADEQGLIHSGFVFSAADFSAMAAVNERNVVLVGANCQFLSPVKFGDEVNFVARLRHKEGRKRNVYVQGHVLDIKVFEGEFKTVITDRHVLRLKLIEEDELQI